jgi:acyl transferase domain-containing protein/acyl carrier protein
MAELTDANFPAQSIAIIGIGGRFPGCRSLDEFWRLVRDGVDVLRTFSDAQLEAAGVPKSLREDPHFVSCGTALDESEWFDEGFFGMTPREAQIIDPQHRIFLECAWEALEYAGYAPANLDVPVGVYAGATMNTYLIAQILGDPQLMESMGAYQLMLGNDKDFLCTRVSYKLNLRGPSMTIQTACSTSLVAVEAACRALNGRECDIALAGGVSVSFPERAGYLYQEGMILSPDGVCRPFDERAAGTRPGAGAGVVVLKRLSDAIADRDTIHAVIRGAAVNNDGAGKAGYTAPSVEGQVEVVALAQALAEVEPRSIDYIEAHGTATPLGDPIEVAALTRAFRASTPDIGFCRLGSLKANFGHLDAAAGVAGLIKTVLALKHRTFPPLTNFRAPNPHLVLEESPFRADDKAAPWVSGPSPRRAGVSSFGIGGTNAHLILEEAPPVTSGPAPVRPRLLTLSAKTATGLQRICADLAGWFEAHPDASLADVEWTLQTGRQAFSHRRAVVVGGAAQGADALRGRGAAAAVHEGGARPVAFLFSGQGSQLAGMGSRLYGAEPSFREAIDRCAQILKECAGLDIRAVMFDPAGSARLRQTENAQAALFCFEYALAELWRHWGVVPSAMIGHSLGEYVAAHLAGVMSLEDALRVVLARGRIMQSMAAGSMVSVQLPSGQLAGYLHSSVEIAAVNAPELCVLAGPTEGIDAVQKELEADGVSCKRLPVSHAFHSVLMEPALEPFAAVLDRVRLQPPMLPYVSNVTGDWITAEQATSPAYYCEHLRRPVQFQAGLRSLSRDPALHWLEIGPGGVLASLARANIEPSAGARVTASVTTVGDEEHAALFHAAARLWVSGVSLDWAAMHGDAEPRRIPLPTYPFERKRHAVDPRPEAEPRPVPPLPEEGVLHSYQPTWVRADFPARELDRLTGAWIVVGRHDALTEAVEAALGAAGARVNVADLGAATGSGPGDRGPNGTNLRESYERLVKAVTLEHGSIQGVVVLNPGAQSGREGYDAVVALACSLGAFDPSRPIRLILAGAGTQSVLKEPIRSWQAALSFGPILVLPTEFPGLQMRSLDLDGEEGSGAHVQIAAAAVAEEATAQDGAVFVARRAGCRWVRRYEPVSLEVGSVALGHTFRSRGRYLITGGLGGIGLTLSTWLARRFSARLLITSRRSLPPRAEWDSLVAAADPEGASWPLDAILSIRTIEGLGGEVVVEAADAADERSMEHAVAMARARWGELDGVVHAAGIAGEGRLAAMTSDTDVDAVLSPKLGGMQVLCRVLGEERLDFVALMSSINAVVGAPGACDYAAANAALAAFAESDARPTGWRRLVAIDWGAWREVGMAARRSVPAAMRAGYEAFLRRAIAPDDGAEIFGCAVASGYSRIVVTSFDLEEAFKASREPDTVRPRTDPLEHERVPPEPAELNRVRDAALALTDSEERLAEIWTELTGVTDIGPDEDFFALGGHSLLATRMMSRVSVAFGVNLALRDVFDAPTLGELARRITEKMHAAADALGPATKDREEIVI